MKKLLILCGPQGSGKTTLAHAIISTFPGDNAYIFDTDVVPSSHLLYDAQVIVVDPQVQPEKIAHWEQALNSDYITVESGIQPLIIICTQHIPSQVEKRKYRKTRKYHILK